MLLSYLRKSVKVKEHMMVTREIKLGASLSTEAVQKALRKARSAEAVQKAQDAMRKARSVGEAALEAATSIITPENSERVDQKQKVASMVERRAFQRATEEPIDAPGESAVSSPPIPSRLNDADYPVTLDTAA